MKDLLNPLGISNSTKLSDVARLIGNTFNWVTRNNIIIHHPEDTSDLDELEYAKYKKILLGNVLKTGEFNSGHLYQSSIDERLKIYIYFLKTKSNYYDGLDAYSKDLSNFSLVYFLDEIFGRINYANYYIQSHNEIDKSELVLINLKNFKLIFTKYQTMRYYSSIEENKFLYIKPQSDSNVSFCFDPLSADDKFFIYDILNFINKNTNISITEALELYFNERWDSNIEKNYFTLKYLYSLFDFINTVFYTPYSYSKLAYTHNLETIDFSRFKSDFRYKGNEDIRNIFSAAVKSIDNINISRSRTHYDTAVILNENNISGIIGSLYGYSSNEYSYFHLLDYLKELNYQVYNYYNFLTLYDLIIDDENKDKVREIFTTTDSLNDLRMLIDDLKDEIQNKVSFLNEHIYIINELEEKLNTDENE